jgi:hypothetical protein
MILKVTCTLNSKQRTEGQKIQSGMKARKKNKEGNPEFCF